MKSLMGSSERGFPNYENMQIRNRIPPAPTTKQDGVELSFAATTTNTTSSSSQNSSPEPQHSLNLLLQQYHKLNEDLDAKSKLIDQLQTELAGRQHSHTHPNGTVSDQRVQNGNGYKAFLVPPFTH
jgi:hypothetical protein